MGRPILIVVAIVLLVGIANSVFIINEAEQAIITQLGKPVGDPIVTPGLKIKLPFFQKVNRFDKRFLEWDGEVNQLPTRDKRLILVDTYARWRITDPLLYFQRLGSERRAQTRLDDILDGETRNAIANHNLVEVVRTSNREAVQDESAPVLDAVLDRIEAGRDQIRQEILAAAQGRTGDLGIEILDVRLKRINYIEDVRLKVYDRMISERKRIAALYLSEGDGEASRIRGEKERELKTIQSEAYRQAQEIRGRADASATEIYARAYNQSREAREFYEFLQSMETFVGTVDDDTSLLLSTDGDFYRYLKGAGSP
ncbi:MAG: protease modulator HflC [Acidobacteriota bacterium]